MGMGPGDQGTFAVFMNFGGAVSFNPAVNRVFLRFTDGNGVTVGATSVAVRFQPPPPTIPNVLGTFHGTGTITQSNCQSPGNNGVFGAAATLRVTAQTGSQFGGSGTASVGNAVDTISVQGTVSTAGVVTGTFTFSTSVSGFFVGSGNGTFTGQLSGNVLTLNLSGKFTVGEKCNVTGVLQLSR